MVVLSGPFLIALIFIIIYLSAGSMVGYKDLPGLKIHLPAIMLNKRHYEWNSNADLVLLM